jgi:hypothetical protein
MYQLHYPMPLPFLLITHVLRLEFEHLSKFEVEIIFELALGYELLEHMGSTHEKQRQKVSCHIPFN